MKQVQGDERTRVQLGNPIRNRPAEFISASLPEAE
ncbi:hypothetical protein SAMN04488023_1254 [Pedobacter rhizosphaerae]|uniref:Uncharacterized protein n=1 Tax=Pedobacter rhizosphaerae TaxID=390241 RepID=A0A1H9TVN8_9SPHI|nr:hypothetical protein SAMN04488023_1254 [Pedobacter rhizosphaerae]